MRTFKLIVLSLLLFAAALPAQAAVEDATVNLYCRLKSGNRIYSTSGSGVFISKRGVILTNAHVAQYFLLATDTMRVKGQCWVRTGSPAKNTYRADVLYFPPAWIDANAEALKKKEPKGTGESDFALLYVTGTKKGPLPASFPFVTPSLIAPTEGESVSVSGYPTDGISSDKIKRGLPFVSASSTVTNVRSFTRTTPDILTIASSSAAGAGVSGGPVVNKDGTLAGIVVAKSEKLLRAITPTHINSAFVAQTGTSLASQVLGDLAERAQTNRLLITPKQLIVLREGLLKRR